MSPMVIPAAHKEGLNSPGLAPHFRFHLLNFALDTSGASSRQSPPLFLPLFGEDNNCISAFEAPAEEAARPYAPPGTATNSI